MILRDYQQETVDLVFVFMILLLCYDQIRCI